MLGKELTKEDLKFLETKQREIAAVVQSYGVVQVDSNCILLETNQFKSLFDLSKVTIVNIDGGYIYEIIDNGIMVKAVELF